MRDLVSLSGRGFESRQVHKRGYRIVAIAADCKSAPHGSVVRVHLPPLKNFVKFENKACENQIYFVSLQSKRETEMFFDMLKI
jgi:hypothetical protein